MDAPAVRSVILIVPNRPKEGIPTDDFAATWRKESTRAIVVLDGLIGIRIWRADSPLYALNEKTRSEEDRKDVNAQADSIHYAAPIL